MCIYEVSQSIFMGGYRLVIIQKSVIVIAVTKYRILFLCHRISWKYQKLNDKLEILYEFSEYEMYSYEIKLGKIANW